MFGSVIISTRKSRIILHSRSTTEYCNRTGQDDNKDDDSGSDVKDSDSDAKDSDGDSDSDVEVDVDVAEEDQPNSPPRSPLHRQ